MIDNRFCTPITFKNPLKTDFPVRIYFNNLTGYFLFEKQAFNGLLKFIGIQNALCKQIFTFLQKSQKKKIVEKEREREREGEIEREIERERERARERKIAKFLFYVYSTI